MSCPNCREDGMLVLECWICGKEKCEDCATNAEVMDQCCVECAKEAGLAIAEPASEEAKP